MTITELETGIPTGLFTSESLLISTTSSGGGTCLSLPKCDLLCYHPFSSRAKSDSFYSEKTASQPGDFDAELNMIQQVYGLTTFKLQMTAEAGEKKITR